MPRFFFDCLNGILSVDDEGTVLEGLAEARKEAIRYAGRCVTDRPELIRHGHQFRIEVSNDERKTLFAVTIGFVPGP